MALISSVISSPRSRRRLGWVSAAVLAVGIVAFVAVYFRNAGTPLEPVTSSAPLRVPKREKTVPLTREARRVAGRFVLTAVARRNLAESWNLTDPTLRQGFTL